MDTSLIPTSLLEQLQKTYSLDPKRMQRALGILARDELHKLPNGNYACRSHSKGAPVEYQINERYDSCTCYDAQELKNGDGTVYKEAQICKHYIAFLILRELERDATDWTAHIKELKHYDPIAEREELARVNQPAKTEWCEEIDESVLLSPTPIQVATPLAPVLIRPMFLEQVELNMLSEETRQLGCRYARTVREYDDLDKGLTGVERELVRTKAHNEFLAALRAEGINVDDRALTTEYALKWFRDDE